MAVRLQRFAGFNQPQENKGISISGEIVAGKLITD
jgi:hypothetical protein